jgi:hypothetical protein
MEPTLLKYPRTQHIQGSRLQRGDEDLKEVPFATLRGAHLVLEEKMDGANSGVSFGPGGQLLLQSRGHYLTGGPRERHFNLLKRWAAAHSHRLYAALGERYLMYGEWLYAKHTVFYDALPHYFMEFDVYDRHQEVFLSTPRRRALLEGLPVVSVSVLHQGALPSLKSLRSRLARSAFKTQGWRDAMRRQAQRQGQDVDRVLAETDGHDEMEGLYIKWEEAGQVRGRYKLVRATFQAALSQSGSHWQSRPILPNQLAPGVDIFAPALKGGAL